MERKKGRRGERKRSQWKSFKEREEDRERSDEGEELDKQGKSSSLL